MNDPVSTSPQSRRPGRVRAVLVPVALFGLAGAMAAGPWQFISPVPAATVVPAWATDPTPVRQPNPRPEIRVAGFTFRCSDCHNLFRSPPETTRQLTQHSHILLKHGINTRCFNCHHMANRDAFVDDWGREIPWDEPPRLCAKCHGPVYRDWLHGSHGRSNGYWDTTRGPQERPKCIACHDPHQPPFPPMTPAPAPHTLRMGDQRPDEEHPGVVDPLRVYQQPGVEDARKHPRANGIRDAGLGGPALQGSAGVSPAVGSAGVSPAHSSRDREGAGQGGADAGLGGPALQDTPADPRAGQEEHQ